MIPNLGNKTNIWALFPKMGEEGNKRKEPKKVNEVLK